MFRLCLAVGCPHPDYLPLDARQCIDWQEFWNLEPFGDDWRQTALLAFISAQKACKKTLSINDFMPNRSPDECEQSPEQTEAEIDCFIETYAGLFPHQTRVI